MKKIVLSLAVLASVALVSCGGSDKAADSCSAACNEPKEAAAPEVKPENTEVKVDTPAAEATTPVEAAPVEAAAPEAAPVEAAPAK